MELNSWRPHPSLERERKIRRRVFASLINFLSEEISRPSRTVTAKKCTKQCNACSELLFWLLNLLLF